MSTPVTTRYQRTPDDAAGDLAIRSIRTTQVNVPLEAPYRWSVGYFPGFTKTIIEIETESGAIGVGEAPNHWAASLIDEAIAPRLLGADPRDLADCERRGLPPIDVLRNTEDESIVRAYGGVEMALWDLNGKIDGRSVAQLLGGRVRDQVSFTEYFACRMASDGRGGESTPADVATYCARMIEEHDAQHFEGKAGVGPIAFDVAVAREVRAAIGPERSLRLDANKGWSVPAARNALAKLEQYDISSVEDPVRSLAEMARLRQTTSIAFSTHDATLSDFSTHGVPDAFVVNLAAMGGIRRTVAFIAACEALGISLWFYSPDTGVANAAYLQVAASQEWICEPSQTLLRWHMDDVIEGGPLVPKSGRLDVPNEPGLGVTLDRAALERCHQRFLADGPYDQTVHPARPGRYGSRNIFVGTHTPDAEGA